MSAWFVMKTADGSERTFALQQSTTVIGRDARCDLRVPIPSVLGRHCEIRRAGEGWEVVSLSADAPVHVNGQPARTARLRAGDLVRIGPAEFVLRTGPDDEPAPNHHPAALAALTETKPVDPAIVEIARRSRDESSSSSRTGD